MSGKKVLSTPWFYQRVANTKGEALPRGPMEKFGRMIFQKKISLGFHILIRSCPMVATRRSARMTDDRSGIVFALEHRFRGRCI